MTKEASAYLSNQFGFSEIGRLDIENIIKPKLKAIGLKVLDPFEECAKELNLDAILAEQDYESRKRLWAEFNRKVTPINNELMRKSDCMCAILDGGHIVDDGVAAEIGYYAGAVKNPIFALRSDLRLGENMAAAVNPQIEGYIFRSGGCIATSPNAMNQWLSEIKTWYDRFKVKGQSI